MNSYLASGISKPCVENLRNSHAITCNLRLDFGYSEAQSISSGLVHNLLKALEA